MKVSATLACAGLLLLTACSGTDASGSTNSPTSAHSGATASTLASDLEGVWWTATEGTPDNPEMYNFLVVHDGEATQGSMAIDGLDGHHYEIEDALTLDRVWDYLRDDAAKLTIDEQARELTDPARCGGCAPDAAVHYTVMKILPQQIVFEVVSDIPGYGTPRAMTYTRYTGPLAPGGPWEGDTAPIASAPR